jgi:hypothetical protein
MDSERRTDDKNNYTDQSITIGNGNKIKQSIVSNTIKTTEPTRNFKKSFSEKHPILLNVIIGLITGFVLLFSFWGNIIDWIEGLF